MLYNTKTGVSASDGLMSCIKTFVGEVLPHCKEAVGLFYCPNRLAYNYFGESKIWQYYVELA